MHEVEFCLMLEHDDDRRCFRQDYFACEPNPFSPSSDWQADKSYPDGHYAQRLTVLAFVSCIFQVQTRLGSLGWDRCLSDSH